MITLLLVLSVTILLTVFLGGLYLTGAVIVTAWKIVLPIILLVVIDVVVLNLIFRRKKK